MEAARIQAEQRHLEDERRIAEERRLAKNRRARERRARRAEEEAAQRTAQWEEGQRRLAATTTALAERRASDLLREQQSRTDLPHPALLAGLRGGNAVVTPQPTTKALLLAPFIVNEMTSMAITLGLQWDCPICLDSKSPGDFTISACGHKICAGCRTGMEQSHTHRCPECRA